MKQLVNKNYLDPSKIVIDISDKNIDLKINLAVVKMIKKNFKEFNVKGGIDSEYDKLVSNAYELHKSGAIEKYNRYLFNLYKDGKLIDNIRIDFI